MNIWLASMLSLAACLVTGCGPRQNYSATPLFSQSAFRQVRKGMTHSEVRELLGCPASRFGPIADPVTGPRTRWEYTVPPAWEPPMRFRSFTVNFGPDGRVLDTLACEASWENSDGAQAAIQAIKQSRRKLGDIALIRPGGSTNVLHGTDPGLHVILIDRDAGAAPRLNRGPGWFFETMPELLRKGTIASVNHLYLGTHSQDYYQLIKELPVERARDCYLFLDSTPEFKATVQDLDSAMLLYKSGELWSVPGTPIGPNAEAAIEDQKWLLHHLAAGRPK